MAIANDFEEFIENIAPDQLDAMNTSVKEIAKKLNNHYYNLKSDDTSHMYVVGSVGRGTSIKGASDLDIIFDLPTEKFTQYDNYGENSNGQSALIQEVKNVLLERYPNTDISGDGQVVVIAFAKYTVELVPGFKQSDNSFKYPDTNAGGTWKITNPLPEIEESKNAAAESNNVFIHICNMLREWKNNIGFKFGGLLIDTLTYNFLNSNTSYKSATFSDYLDIVKDIFSYLKGLNKEQSYWFALGSNQHVYNSSNGNFIDKAKDAFEKLETLLDDNCNAILIEIFGNKFPKTTSSETTDYALMEKQTERFIYQLFSVDIRYSLQIDCDVKSKIKAGNRTTDFSQSLRYMLSNRFALHTGKDLVFKIIKCDVPGGAESCDIYWKIKNNGQEAYDRDCFRGQIEKTNCTKHFERTDFKGNHYVECFLVKNGICVAKDRIDVPIG